FSILRVSTKTFFQLEQNLDEKIKSRWVGVARGGPGFVDIRSECWARIQIMNTSLLQRDNLWWNLISNILSKNEVQKNNKRKAEKKVEKWHRQSVTLKRNKKHLFCDLRGLEFH